MNPLRIIALLLLLALSQGASATTFYWESAGFTGASPSAVCEQVRASEWAGYVRNGEAPYYENMPPNLTKISDIRYHCQLVVRSLIQGDVRPGQTWAIGRYGDSCAAGSIYNQNSASCELTQCKAKEGRFLNFASSGLLPGSACIGGCAAALPQQHRYENPKTGRVTYSYEGNYTGNDCSGSNPAGYSECSLEEDCTKDLSAPEVEKSNECQAAADEVDASGRTWKVSNCTATEISQQQQDDNCNWGTAGAGAENNWTCVTKPGKNNETKTETTTKTTTNPDGSKDTKQTITTTETKCTGVNSCTTTTTTTTNSNHTNADGSPGNSSSSCKGSKCPSGEGEGEGEEEEGDDDIAGPTKQLVGKTSPGFGEASAEWQTKIDTARQQLDGLINQYSNLFSGAFDLNIGTGGGALPCYQIPIVSRFINTTLDFCPAKFEDQLIYLKYILLAAAAILAGFIVLRN